MGKKNQKTAPKKPEPPALNLPSPPDSNRFRPLLLLAIFGVLWHGFLLTNDGTIWDSWYVKSWLQDKNWRVLDEFFGSVGMPMYGWLYKLFAWFPNLIGAFMTATVACLLLQSFLTYTLAREMAGLTSLESFCIALLTQSSPVFSASQDFIMFFFILTHTLFLGAALMAARAAKKSGRPRLILRGTALLLFFVSFYNAALLVFYAGFFMLLFFSSRTNTGQRESFLKSGWRFCSSNPDFLFLPPIAWAFRSIFTPQFGWYADYNNPLSNLPLVLPAFQSFLTCIPPFHFTQTLQWISTHPATVCLLGASITAGALLTPRTLSPVQSPTRSLSLMAFGGILLVLAILPFAAAGKKFSPIPTGDQSRYAMLAPLPIALLIFSPLRALLMRCRPPHAAGYGARWVLPVCVGISLVCGLQIPAVYVAERAEWIEHRSILHNALQSNAIRQSSVVILQNCRMTSQIVYGIYAFRSVFGDSSRLVTPAGPQNGQYFTPSEILMQLQRTTMLPNSLNLVNPSGQQILLGVHKNRAHESDWDIVQNYLRRVWFGDEKEVQDYLSNLTSLQTRILRVAKPLILASHDSTRNIPPNTDHIINSLGMQMIPIGSAFWVSKYETTQNQYLKLTGKNPSLFQDPARPVERVSWKEAVSFCQKLTEMEKAEGKLPEGFVYRLPTVAEFSGFNPTPTAPDAVLADATLYWQTQPVGSAEPNALGLCDTAGNVWEWTLDWGDKLHLMRLAVGGGFANSPFELALHPQRFQPMDFYTRSVIHRLFGPSRPDYPDQAFWDKGFRPVLAKPAPHFPETKGPVF